MPSRMHPTNAGTNCHSDPADSALSLRDVDRAEAEGQMLPAPSKGLPVCAVNEYCSMGVAAQHARNVTRKRACPVPMRSRCARCCKRAR